MKYFTNAEDKPFHHWQLELLIESFKVLQCEENLLIALSQSDEPSNEKFTYNIKKHKNIYHCENIGKIRGYNNLNNLYTLLWSIKNEKITQPFVVIQPHIILKSKFNYNFNKTSPEIVFAPDPFFTLEKAEEEVGPFWEWFNQSKEQFKNQWIPIGSIIAFNNIPIEIFDANISIAEKLAIHQIVNKEKIWEYTDRLALSINLSNYIGKITFNGNYNLATNMVWTGENSPFIDCEHGLPPLFNKNMFQYQPPNFISFGDPIEILSNQYPTHNAYFISQLAKINLEKRNK